MRITVNLSLFLHDHRCLAKIFINKNIKTISDLESRITEIFSIQDFYLKCDGQYLPPLEDVHVLNYDDIVWALPKSEDQLSNQKNVISSSTAEYEQLEKKKKKKKKEHKELSDSELSIQHKKKKREKKKREREECSERNEQSSEDPNENERRCKKLKLKLKVHKPPTTSDNFVSRCSGGDSSDNSKSVETENESKGLCVKSIVDSLEKKIDFKKCLKNSFTPVLPKKTNIVKTIIISHNQPGLASEISSTSGVNNSQSQATENDVSTKSDSSQEIISNMQKTSNVEEDSQNTIEMSDTISSYGDIPETDPEGNEKRKRKRIRKRRRVNANKSDETDILQKSENTAFTFIPRPLLTKTSCGSHVRFKNDFNNISSPKSTVVDESVVNGNSIEKVNSKEDANESIKIIDVTEVINNNELTEEFILKQPLMEHILPKKGDIIAFKIIRISESYTPEVSTRIVGKVSNYDRENMEVTFSVLYGQEQYAQPQGKFSLSFNNEEEASEEEIDTTFQCTWSSVLDPRLLYP